MISFSTSAVSVPLRWLWWLVAPIGFSVAFWVAFGASVGCFGCIDDPLVADPDPIARVVVSWDPLACGDDPHRVVVELADEMGGPLEGSAPCNRGGLTLTAGHYGRYTGTAYAWLLDEPARSWTAVSLTLDQETLYLAIATPR